jgi:hypothetical protein
LSGTPIDRAASGFEPQATTRLSGSRNGGGETGIDKAEDACVDSDAEREGEDRRGGEAGLPAKGTSGETHIPEKILVRLGHNALPPQAL